jgi:hypothetical protein
MAPSLTVDATNYTHVIPLGGSRAGETPANRTWAAD